MIRTSEKNSKLHNERSDVAESRVSFGYLSCLALRNAIKQTASDNEVLWGLLHRLEACSLPLNHWIGDDLHNEETGELYEANGNFWGCGSRLCPNCVAKLSRRSRKQLRLAIKDQKLLIGEHYRFITLTMPNPNRTLLATRKIIDRAWQLFRKRDYFKNKIRGGSKSEEFTVTENRYHYHIHILCISRFINYDVFRQDWTECLETAFRENNIPFNVRTADGLAMIKVEKVSGRRNIENAILEVCKYITKNDSWEKIPAEDLIEIASIKRFPRMFELFGCFREGRKKQIDDLNNPIPDDQTDIRETENVGEYTILDTKHIFDGENSCLDEFSGTSPPEIPKKRQRAMNWRDFIEAYGIEDYVERLTNELHRALEWRKLALKEKYPYATFRTLVGETF